MRQSQSSTFHSLSSIYRPRSVFRSSVFLSVALLLVCGAATAAQEQTMTLDDLAESAQQWARQNLDQDLLHALDQADRHSVQQFLNDIQKLSRGEQVADMGALKDTAKAILPLLEKYEETYPYALWLKAQLDSLEVADQLKSATPPKGKAGQAPARAPNPQPQTAREIWIKKVSTEPWPENAKRYVSRLKPIFKAQGAPAELVWVAEVESSFDPRARSPAGAAGLFQLTPETAKHYGLKTWFPDQRLSAETSATAAAKYLHYLHTHFKDWRLALAAYNSGQGTVDRLLARHKDETYDAIATHLPAETQMYVPRVEAVLLRREGVRLGDLDAGGR